LFPIAMVLVVFAKDLVFVWTDNLIIASSVAPVIALLAIGSALHGVMYFPYALQLAYGMTSLSLTINAILMILLVPLIIFFALTYGALGGAMAWLVLHLLYLLLGTWLTHRTLLKGLGAGWLLQDVGIPLILSILLGLMAYYYILQNAEYSILLKLIIGGTLALLSFVLSISSSSQLRTVMLDSLRDKKSQLYK
jgi:hypothetical protein